MSAVVSSIIDKKWLYVETTLWIAVYMVVISVVTSFVSFPYSIILLSVIVVLLACYRRSRIKHKFDNGDDDGGNKLGHDAGGDDGTFFDRDAGYAKSCTNFSGGITSKKEAASAATA